MQNKGILIIVSGPSGVGKGTICKQLLADCPDIVLSVSATTRSPRPEDTEGVTYYFKTQDEFKSLIDTNSFIEWAIYNGNYYGTLKDEVTQKLNNGLNVLLEIDVQGAINVMEQNLEGLFIFIAPPDKEVLHTRLKGRGTEPQEEIDRRIAAADLELENMNKYDHVIVNDVLETAVLEIKDIIKARRVSL